MLLETINGPADLQGRSYDELDDLCEQIREHVVGAVEEHGGHLGSNLGAVELTVALHRVFRSPHDAILWDTGHQAYVHKMLTGRVGQFSRLRKADGLSGYPSRAESEHDWIENSHASTVLSYAHGLATAYHTKDERRRVVAVIGDGALTGGMAFEGLNNLGHSGRDVVIVLNDNGRSYAPTVSRLSESLIKIRNNPVYMRRQARVEEIAERVPWVGEQIGRGVKMSKAAIREMWEPPAFFENLGIRYLGPFDGHDIEGLEDALDNAAEFDGPVLVHVLTQKGRGYAPAENDDIKNMHDTSGIKAGSYTQAFTETLIKLAEEHDDLVAITAAMPDSTGLLPFRERFPERTHDVGITEQHAVTAAAGMAMGGLRPVVAVYSTFMSRAFDQVNLDVGLHRQPVIFCLDRAGVTGDDGASHHGLLDMVLFSKVPGMTVFAPSSYQELQVQLGDAVELCTDGPAMIRWSKQPAPSVSEAEVGSGLRGRKVRSGTDVCLIGVGNMLSAAIEAADLLAERGVSASVWDPRVIRPIDPAMVTDAAQHRLVVSIEDGLRDGGAGDGFRDAIEDHLEQAAIDDSCRVRVLGMPTTYIPHDKPATILARHGLDAPGLVAEVLGALG
ncbi:MAG: 1-deoxy-D-xylulose-5-phosphate synthase [Acidimicrobiales bacterium]